MSVLTEYRGDDNNIGFCPVCGRKLTEITMGARGFCEVHGWVAADWTRPSPRCPECGNNEMRFDDHVWGCPKCGYETTDPFDEDEEGEWP